MKNQLNLLPDKELLEQLKSEQAAAYHLLYKAYFPSIAYYIRQNKGNMADAEDIFQEAVIVFLEKIRHENFTLSSSIKTYLYAIARNFWLKRLRDERLVPTDDDQYLATIGDVSATASTETEPENSPEELTQHILGGITKNCQRIMQALYFLNEPMESLMQKMGWKNKHSAINQKHKCILQLRKSAQSLKRA